MKTPQQDVGGQPATRHEMEIEPRLEPFTLIRTGVPGSGCWHFNVLQEMKPFTNLVFLAVAVVICVLLSQCEKKPISNSATKAKPQMTAGDRFWLFREACRSGDEKGVRILLRLGADIDGFNDYKEFHDAGYVEDAGWGMEPSWPINQAAWNGHANIVKILIEEGAKIDNFEGEGNTALINAAYKGHMEIVEMLLKAGADPKLKGVNGWTSEDAAKAGNHEDIYNLLRKLTDSPGVAPPEYGTTR